MQIRNGQINASPPYARLGAATSAALSEFEKFANAKAKREIDAKQAQERMLQIDGELARHQGEAAKDHFRELVAEYEKRVRSAGLHQLSEDVRSAAKRAGVPIEKHSPLIDPEWLTIGGYPLQYPR